VASELTIDGYDAILKRLESLDEDLRDRISKVALEAGAKVVQEAIRSEVNISNRNEIHIRNDIQIGKPKRIDGGWVVKIGPGKKTAWRAKFIEFGHAKRGGGTVPAHPFMEPALERSKTDFRNAVAEAISREL